MSVGGVSSAAGAFAAQAKSIEEQIAACDKAIASAKTDAIKKEKKGERARLEAQLAAANAAESQASARASGAARSKQTERTSTAAGADSATTRAAKRRGALVDLYA